MITKTISPKKKGKATELSEKVAERLFSLRNSLGYTQRTMAEKIDVTFQQYQKYEKAKDRLSLERAIVLCEKLGLPLTIFNENNAAAKGFAESGQAPFGSAAQGSKARAEEDELIALFRSVPRKSRKDFIEMVEKTAKLLSGKN